MTGPIEPCARTSSLIRTLGCSPGPSCPRWTTSWPSTWGRAPGMRSVPTWPREPMFGVGGRGRPDSRPRALHPSSRVAARSGGRRRDQRRGAPAGGGDRDTRPAALRCGPDPGAAPAVAARPLTAVVGLLQAVDVELLHLHHGLHDPVRLFRILVSQELAEHGGNDLPRDAELVLEPAALVFGSTGGQLLPQLVHFLLRLAVHEQGYRRRELELRAAVQGVEVLPLELEGAAHHRPLRPGSCVSVPRHPHDFGALEDRHVEVHLLFGVGVEPQERDDLLHGRLAMSERPDRHGSGNQWLIAKNQAAMTGPRG